MTDKEKAARDLKREMIIRSLEATDEGNIAEISLPELRAMLDKNEKTYDEICELQASLLAAARNANARRAAMDWLPGVEAEYREVRKRLSERIARIEQADNRPARPSHVGSQVGSVPQPRPGPSHLGFPEGLTEFDGTHANWPSFRDLFIALVDSREYSNLSKLLHLKRACTGPASLTLAGYDPLQDCYNDAWEALRGIYDDNYAIVQSLLDRLIDMPPARTAEVSQLRRVIDTVTSTLRQLTTLNLEVQHWDAFVINLTVRKLPASVIEPWEQQRKRSETPNLRSLLEYLEGKARSRVFSSNQLGVMDKKRTASEPPHRNNPRNNPKRRSTENLYFQVKRGNQECRICRGEHLLIHCEDLKLRSLPQRRDALLKLGVCLNCLNFGHLKARCERLGCRQRRCQGDKHHWLICPNSIDNANRSNSKGGSGSAQVKPDKK